MFGSKDGGGGKYNLPILGERQKLEGRNFDPFQLLNRARVEIPFIPSSILFQPNSMLNVFKLRVMLLMGLVMPRMEFWVFEGYSVGWVVLWSCVCMYDSQLVILDLMLQWCFWWVLAASALYRWLTKVE